MQAARDQPQARLAGFLYMTPLPGITGEATGKQLSAFASGWQKARPDTSMDFFTQSNNGLVLCTGEHSDIIALDLDKPKPDDAAAGRLDGIQLMHALIEQHGPILGAPVQRTGSGGEHILFSLSSSLEHGLLKAKNQTKLRVDGKETTIDIRGDNGCLVVYPSSYITKDGVLHEYTWISPLGDRDELPPMPDWLIALVNDGGKRSREEAGLPISANKRRTPDANSSTSYQALTMDAVQQVTGTISRSWPRTNGYDYSPLDRHPSCRLCGHVHSSNNYICRRVISTCFSLGNYSSNCCTKTFGEHEVLALKELLAAPTSDDRVVKMLQLVTRDVGHELKYTGKQWLCFQGLIWEPLSDIEIERRIKQDVNYDVIETLIKIMRHRAKWEERNGKMPDDKDKSSMIEALIKVNRFLMKAANISSVAKTAKQLLLDEGIAKQLDTNKDLIAASNGVIELRTGLIRKASSFDYLSRNVEATYPGPASPTPIVDAFFDSIFNGDLGVISYVQRLLGYAITGHTSSQKMAIWTGAGSNGKSLLLACLSKLLGPTMYCTPAREVFFEGGRQTTAGGHTAHLTPLVGKLIVAREELNKSDRLDIALIKLMTGEGDIVSRAPYSSEYVTFKPTHLPILACNQLPPIDVDDEGTLRRLIVVPFVNTYLGPDDRVLFDPSNTHHRHKDPQLKDKLTTTEAQSQLLVWLVKGAAAWFERGLDDPPQLLRSSLTRYISDNDALHSFIEEECDITQGAMVNAAQFRERLEGRGQKMKQKELTPKMMHRGFVCKVAWQKASNKAERVFLGLQWK